MSGETDPVRAEGPAVVVDGDTEGARIIVLDPAGEGKHDELPATWRPFTARRRVIWCRLPVDGALSQAEELLDEADPEGPPVDVVASGHAADEALRLAERHPGAAGHLLLLDPGADGETDENWLTGHTDQLEKLRSEGTVVKVLPHSSGEPFNRVPPPLPLGHPDVVAAVTRILVDV